MSCNSSGVRACYLSVILSVQLVIMEMIVPGGPYRAFTVRGGGGYRDMSCNSFGARACNLSVILSV